MADDRPGFTPGEVGERAGRADARPRLTCSLATVSQDLSRPRCGGVCVNGSGRPPPRVDYRSDVPLWRDRA
jgi:hypothetical protein